MSTIYGFVYLWFDRRRKMYYVGSHWGTENDGYICSSDSMREAHRRRPNDFKRRIIAKVYSDRKELLNEEQRWLNMIKKEEIKVKFYNAGRCASGGGTHSEETLTKIREAQKKTWNDPEYRNMMIEKFKAVPGEKRSHHHSEETKEYFREIRKILGNNNSPGMTGMKHSEETKQKMVETRTGKKTKANSSGYVGVSWHNIGKKWQARFKDKHLGLFDTKELAYAAYLDASK